MQSLCYFACNKLAELGFCLRCGLRFYVCVCVSFDLVCVADLLVS